MSTKRKRVVLSLSDKVDIVNRLREGQSGIRLAEEYGIGSSTISDIKRNGDSILKFYSLMDKENGPSARKTMKKAVNDKLDNAVYMWFRQNRSSGRPISGPLLCEKALVFNELLGGDPEFKASSGWLKNFKSRHAIRGLGVHVEMSGDSAETETFARNLESVIKDLNYDCDCVYAADETVLKWKSIPEKSPETDTPVRKKARDRVNILMCANASGSHRLPLFMSGVEELADKPDDMEVFPVIYNCHRNALISAEMFVHWYDNVFVPEVRKHQERTGKLGKVLLLVDKAPSHPTSELLKREDGMCRIMFLPVTVASFLQPMEQGLAAELRYLYRKQLIGRLADDVEDGNVVRFSENLDLRNCCATVADSWSSLKNSKFQKAWSKIFMKIEDDDPEEYTELVNEITAAVNAIPGVLEYDTQEITEWLNCDADDQGRECLTDEEIVEFVKEEEELAQLVKDESIGVPTQERRPDKSRKRDSQEEVVPSHSEAIKCLEKAMQWLARQEECNSSDILCLKKLRDLAAEKSKTSSNPLTVSELSRFLCVASYTANVHTL